MANNIKILANGTLGLSQSPALYSPSGTKSALITSIWLLNKSSTNSRPVTLYVVPSGSSSDDARILSATLAVNGQASVTDVITLAGGDSLTGVTTAATDVHYVVYGVERD